MVRNRRHSIQPITARKIIAQPIRMLGNGMMMARYGHVYRSYWYENDSNAYNECTVLDDRNVSGHYKIELCAAGFTTPRTSNLSIWVVIKNMPKLFDCSQFFWVFFSLLDKGYVPCFAVQLSFGEDTRSDLRHLGEEQKHIITTHSIELETTTNSSNRLKYSSFLLIQTWLCSSTKDAFNTELASSQGRTPCPMSKSRWY